MKFALLFAWRHLRSGGSQTLLIIGGVAVAVMLVVFVSGLIVGVQRRIIDIIAGSIPHVTVLPPEYDPRVAPGALGSVAEREAQRQEITNWRRLVGELETFPHVSAVSPELRGQAIASVGSQEISVQVLGAIPEQRDQIVSLQQDIVSGSLADLRTGRALIGQTLANDLKVTLDDRFRLTSGAGRIETYRVAVIISTGQEPTDANFVMLTLDDAQSFFGVGAAVNAISLHLDEIFEANAVADRIEQSLGVETESWMRQNTALLNGLRAQSASVAMISIFSMAAAGFAIASVLIVSVLKRMREIGILKAMGARSRQVLLIFTLEGLGVGLAGSALGSLLGSLLVVLLRRIPQRGTGAFGPPGELESLFPGVVLPGMIVLTVISMLLISLLASVLPARQAARLEPAEVIRGG